MRQSQIRLAYHRSQYAPSPLLLLLLGDNRQLILIRFHVCFQHVRLVRLPHIEKLPRGFRRILRDVAQPAARLHHRLHRQRLVKRNPHSVFHAQALLVRFSCGLLTFRRENLPIQPQLAAQDHILLHKHSLLSSAIRSAANLIAAIPDRRIRPQPGLSRTPRRRPHPSLRLRQRRIVPEGDLLQLFQRQPGLVRTRLLRRSCSGDRLRRQRRRPQRAQKNNQQQKIPNCLASHHQSPIRRVHHSQSLLLLARPNHPRRRRPAVLPPFLPQTHNLLITLRRQHPNQSHHPLHVPAPSRTQSKSLRLLHHRVHRHRRTLHKRILRKSRHRIRILTDIRLPHLHPTHPLRRRLRRRSPVRSRLRQCRSNSHPSPHSPPPSPPPLATSPCLLPSPRPPPFPRVASSAPPWTTSDSSCDVACGNESSNPPDSSPQTPHCATAPLPPAAYCSAPKSPAAAARPPSR